MERYASVVRTSEIQSPLKVAVADAVDCATENGRWRGAAVFVYERDGWTIFDDLSGHCGARSAGDWLDFAQSDDFVFAAYNDAIGYGELVVIVEGVVVREYLFDSDSPEANVDKGCLKDSPIEPMKSWIGPARFVDDDPLYFSDSGLLWIHG